MTTPNTPDTTTVLSPEILKAELTIALSKEGLSYQTLLQEGEDIKFTRDNVETERVKLAELEKVEKKLSEASNPFTARWKAWNESRKSLVDPVAKIVADKKAELAKIAQQIEAEKKAIEDEANRIKGIKDSIDKFFLEQSNAIALAATPDDLVVIEKRIGSHRRAARYDGFFDVMDAKAANLTDLIKQQKDSLRTLSGLKSAENAANDTGDDQGVLDAREAIEAITAKIEEKKQKVQETALGMATSADTSPITPQVILPDIKVKRKVWKYQVTDMKAAQKAGLTLTVIDEAKVKAILADKRESETEVTENGIRYYIEKYW